MRNKDFRNHSLASRDGRSAYHHVWNVGQRELAARCLNAASVTVHTFGGAAHLF
jgi:hypothetical protein